MAAAIIITVLLIAFFLLVAGMALGQMLYQLSEYDMKKKEEQSKNE